MQKLNALVADLSGIWTTTSDRAETLTAMETLGERLDEIADEVEKPLISPRRRVRLRAG